MEMPMKTWVVRRLEYPFLNPCQTYEKEQEGKTREERIRRRNVK
jgi:hypothetical protein